MHFLGLFRKECNRKGHSGLLEVTSVTCSMDSSLWNSDIHEFLACLGKHAVSKATRGLSNLHTGEPERSKMVFVEDTDELMHLNESCGSLDREHKGVAFGGRQKNMHNRTAGWGAKKEASAHREWKKQEDNSGWGDDPGGWETGTQRDSNSGWGEDSSGGWGNGTRQDANAGWGEETKGQGAEDTFNGWGSGTQKNTNTGWEEEKAVITGGWGEEKEVCFDGWEADTQKEDTDTGWGAGTEKGGTDSGWGSSTQKEGDVGGNGWDDIKQKEGNSGWGEESEVAGDKWGKEKEGTHGGWGKRTAKEDTCIGRSRSTQMESNTGYEGENEATAGGWVKDKRVASGRGKFTPKKDTSIRWGSTFQEGKTRCGEETVVTDGGWGKEEIAACGWEKGREKKYTRTGWQSSTQKEHYRTWGNKNGDEWGIKKKVSSGGWEKYTPKEDEWGSGAQKKGDAGWDKDNEVLAGGLGGEKTVGWGETTLKIDSCNEWGSSTQKEVDTGWGEDNAGGWGEEKTAGWENKRDACNEWGSNIQKEGENGWGGNDRWGKEKAVGWGKRSSKGDFCIGGGAQREGDTGWGDDNELLDDGWKGEKTAGWEEVTPERDGRIEWGSGTQKEADAGWGEDNEADKAARAEKGTPKIDASVGGASSSQKEASTRWGEGDCVKKVASGRCGKGMNERSSFIQWKNSTQEGGAGWAKDKVPSGGHGAENNVSPNNWVEDTQKNDAHIGWESCTQIEGNVGWGEAEHCGWGPSSQEEVHDGWKEKEDGMGWGEKKKVNCHEWEKNTQGDNSGWDLAQNDPNSEAKSKDGLSNSAWDVGGGKQMDDNGWDCTHEASTDLDDGWELKSEHKPQKGWLANPAQTSMNVSNSTRSYNADKRRTGTFGPSGSNMVPLGKRSFSKISSGNPENGHNQSDRAGKADWNSTTEHVAADSSDWGSELLAGDGWNDTKSEAEGVTPRPSKKLNKSFGANSWTAAVSNSQNRRPHLKALINLPECSELNRLYKATNKILHYSGYQSGDKLSPEDEKFILEEVLVHHREKDAKLGCGVDYVMIDSHVDHQVSCFWVVRKDGSKTDFSYWKCLENLFDLRYSHVTTKEVSEEASKAYWRRGMQSEAPIRRTHSQLVEENSSKDGW